MAMKYVTRAQWGARAYRLPGGATLYSGSKRRGVKLHYLGGPYSDRPHGECAAYVRKIQADHMDRNGWSDIGYSHVVCTHGYVYEGRGLKRRNSANGNTTLNDQDYAVLLLVGTSGVVKPTTAQMHGGRDAIDHCRKSGPAGSWLGGHRDGYATACPGAAIYAWAKAGAPRPGGTVPPIVSNPPEEDMPLTDADVKKNWNLDFVKAPDGSATNPTWAPSSYLRDTNIRTRDVQAKLAALGKVELSPEHITALAAALAANPALVDNLADVIADKLAARLAE